MVMVRNLPHQPIISTAYLKKIKELPSDYRLPRFISVQFKKFNFHFWKVFHFYGGSFRTYQNKLCILCFLKQNSFGFVSASKNLSVIVFRSKRKYFVVFSSKRKYLALFPQVKIYL